MNNPTTQFNPERRLQEISGKLFKRAFLLIISLLGYWQLYEYVSEKPNINIELKSSVLNDKKYTSDIEIKNGSESFSKEDVISPIEIIFTDQISNVIVPESTIKLKYQIKNNVLYISFDLLNKNEKYNLKIISNKRPQISNLKYRIKGIEKINFYDYENKPSPIWRNFNIWLIFLIFAIITLADSLLVILKDRGLGEIKSFVNAFPLNINNRELFIETYKQLYSNYKLKLKPSADFMAFTVRNSVYMYNEYKENDVEFIKHLVNLKTELFILYRLRTVFIILSPLLFIISLSGLIFNYIYYEFDLTYTYLNLEMINKTLATCVLLVILYVLFNPRKTMNNLLLTKDAKVKF